MNPSSFSPLFYRLLFVFVVVVVLCPCDARRPRAFIHIGPHKTGSTTIQEVLANLRLNNQLPPSTKTLEYGPPKGLAPFATSIMLNEVLTPYDTILYEINKKDKDIILSSEAFDTPINKRATDRLAEIFKDYDVTIIAFLREPLAHLVSYWTQMICKSFESSTLSEYLNARLADLKMISSFPPPSQVSSFDLKKIHRGGNSTQFRELLGGNGWELFRTLDLYRHSFNVTTKKERMNSRRREGENEIVLIDFDGVLASGKTLPGVLINEIVGLKDINAMDLHSNSKNQEITALHLQLFFSHRGPRSCPKIVKSMKARRKLLEAGGALKACSEVIDFHKIKRELDDYFRRNLKESGFEVLYGGKGKEWTGIKDCYVVDEEVVKTIYLGGKRGKRRGKREEIGFTEAPGGSWRNRN